VRDSRSTLVQPQVAEQVCDRGRLHYGDVTQGKVADRPNKLFKLASDASSLAGVVAIMRPRGELIDQNTTIDGYK